ncbi:MAG: Nif3-like dinuclear metal center hexameric protein [Acaryochloridaceae cyanobacterium SU_2_1]|nr:Nif3-like dinuclear metal center hexameric protein [Acaryochloridaceae cyanobacterium SU_2_1]
MEIAALIDQFEAWANPHWQEKWDNCGWQIQPGVLDQPAHVLVCLTPTLAVMAEAIASQQAGRPVNLIFAHHPLIFTPLKSVQQGEPIAEMIRLALCHQIGLYSAHTNFDQVRDGTADVLSQLLNLQGAEPVVSTQEGLGYGRVGDLAPTLTLQQLLSMIQSILNPPQLLISPGVDQGQLIQRMAVLGGSGAAYIEAVSQRGAQAYLTSDCKFHQFQESRDRHLILIDAGHYATERPACKRLVEQFQAWGVASASLSQQDEDFRNFWKPEGTTASPIKM